MRTNRFLVFGAALCAIALGTLVSAGSAQARDDRCRARSDFDIDGLVDGGECSVKWRVKKVGDRADIQCRAPAGAMIGGTALEGETFEAINTDNVGEKLVECTFEEVLGALVCEGREEDRASPQHANPTGDDITVQDVNSVISDLMVEEECEED